MKSIEHGRHSVEVFRQVPRTGVIFVMGEAAKRGYTPEDPGWTNFGQGQPDVGEIPCAPARVSSIELAPEDQEYSPVAGLWELREAVASHYNRLYRRGLPTQYSAENVCISSGGRAGLTRLAASLGSINLGHFLPDYTAYQELLGLFRYFSPIPLPLDPARGYHIEVSELEREVLGRGLSALLVSNPCNPTGKLIGGDELQAWVSMARRSECTLMLDEFYSHYVWEHSPAQATAASYVEDVNADPVILLNGLTKSWRYPGWRISWTLGPVDVIDRISSAGSFLDGGASRPLQRATIPLLEDAHCVAEIDAIRQNFVPKRDKLVQRLRAMGLKIDRVPDGTFYVWADVSQLADGINTGMEFFQAALEHQVICVPGVFFDINPGFRRSERTSQFRNHVRFSFGPKWESLDGGLSRLEAMVEQSTPAAVRTVPSMA